MLKSALLVTAGIIVGAGAIHGLPAAGSPPVYSIAEINVKDRAAYEKELPAVLKAIKDGGGLYIAGGFDRATLDYGSPPIGNRVSVIRYEVVMPMTKSGIPASRSGLTTSTKRASPASG
jgi:hypothetical protein